MNIKADNFSSITLLRANFYVFDKNYEQMKKLIEYLNDSEDIFIRLNDIQNVQDILAEMARLLHNFIASAKSLVEYTRKLMNERYKNENFYEQYQSEVRARFISNHLSGFIEELRNYVLHYSLPLGSINTSMTRNPETDLCDMRISFRLKKVNLLLWDGWTAKKGRAFLNHTDDEIDIERLIDDYYKQTVSIQVWTCKNIWIHQAVKLGIDINNLPSDVKNLDEHILLLLAYSSCYAYQTYLDQKD